jgi:hypothetical protein
MTHEHAASFMDTPSGYFSATTREHPGRLEQYRPGQHVWVAAATYRLDPAGLHEAALTGGQVQLDDENLAVVVIGCYLCTDRWSPRTAAQPCPGDILDSPAES